MKKFTLILFAALLAVNFTFGSNGNFPKPSKKYFTMNANLAADEVQAKTVILKVKPLYRDNCSLNAISSIELNTLFQAIGMNSLAKMFPYEKVPVRATNDMGLKMIDITTIYTLTYTGNFTEENVVNWVYATGMFEYVQPYYIPKAFFTPNDYNAANQPWLGTTRVNALTGWDTQQGDSAVVIGITDTGTELTHTDLFNQVKRNLNDPIGGGDQDGDGYIDNYRGWDVSMNDNDATYQSNPHGVHVSGCAAAHTNNGTGCSSTGFKCKFLPVKISNASGTLNAAYQGIQYAAAHGCAIINCSWGGGGAGPFEQNIVDYATINNNSLVVAAAGNNNLDEIFFPAALNYVISVAATNGTNDIKASFSNYNYTVDVSSPGNNIYATYNGNSYASLSGTSMASPVAAGVCGIIKSQFPTYNALQVGEHLKATTDYIYSIPSNGPFINKLGTGRVDMANAMTASNPKSVLYLSQIRTDNNDNIFNINDTLRITGDFTNMLTAVTAATTGTIATTSPYITTLDGSYPIGALATLGINANGADPFEFRILPTCPMNQVITFTLTISDSPWSAVTYFDITVNPDYINITVNQIETTITSKGRIGYNADGQQQGLGFQYLDSNLMYESSMMLGNSATKVSDMFRGGANMDTDNATLLRVYQVIPAQVSAFDVEGVHNDATNPSGPIGIRTHHKGWAWTTPGNTKYVIVEYVLTNTNVTTVSNLYCGIITDWDIMNYALNKADQNTPIRMGYVYSTQVNGLYAGTKLLTTTAPFIHHAVDNIAGGGGGPIDPTAGTPAFDTGEKFTSLSTQRAQAGVPGPGNDVMDCVASGPYTIAPGDSVVVAFALIAGDNLADLNTGAGNAQITYDGLLTGNTLAQLASELTIGTFPVPASDELYITINVPATAMTKMSMFNMMGQEVKLIVSEKLENGKHIFRVDTKDLAAGSYFLKLTSEGKANTHKVIITK